jgi:DNA (cytosine-5)-methyltransferase 1
VDLLSGNYISLCSGIGGLDLGVKLALPGSRCVCYVEKDIYSTSILVARMEDQALDMAPIWTDLLTFDPGPWRGLVSGVVAGFPCQPVSVAGKRAGENDERWIFGEVMRVVRGVGARWVFLENVPGILSMGLGCVLGELAEGGYDSQWLCVSAASVGAPHKRERWFGLAYPGVEGLERRIRHQNPDQWIPRARGDKMGDTFCGPAQRWRKPEAVARKVDDSREQTKGAGNAGWGSFDDSGRGIFPPPPGSPDWERIPPEAQPAICGVIDGAPPRVDRLRALGNGVVPLQAATALRELHRRSKG